MSAANPFPHLKFPPTILTAQPEPPAPPARVVPQPDANGEFSNPSLGAKFMAALGIPQIPTRGKMAFLKDWPAKATTDFAQIDKWFTEHKCNFGSVAQAKIGGFFVFEVDSYDVKKRFKYATGHEFSNTLTIGSKKGGHRYFLQTPETIILATNKIRTASAKNSMMTACSAVRANRRLSICILKINQRRSSSLCAVADRCQA